MLVVLAIGGTAARAITLDPAWPQAEAVAVTGDRIVFVGGSADAASCAGRALA